MEGYALKLPKKDDISSSSIYRRITLLSILGKVFSRMLLKRMKEAADPNFETNRSAFARADTAQTRL